MAEVAEFMGIHRVGSATGPREMMSRWAEVQASHCDRAGLLCFRDSQCQGKDGC